MLVHGLGVCSVAGCDCHERPGGSIASRVLQGQILNNDIYGNCLSNIYVDANVYGSP